MAKLHLYKDATPGLQDGVEIMNMDSILADFLPSRNHMGIQVIALCVRCEPGWFVQQLIATCVHTYPNNPRIRVGYTYLNTLADVKTASIVGVAYNAVALKDAVTITDIGQVNKLFYLYVMGYSSESGNLIDGTLNLSFAEEAI